LLDRGDPVVGLDNLNDYYPRLHKDRHLSDLLPEKNFHFIEADIRDAERVKSISRSTSRLR
jgi:UDP-glucuronate 4-epimerase